MIEMEKYIELAAETAIEMIAVAAANGWEPEALRGLGQLLGDYSIKLYYRMKAVGL